MAVTVTQSRLAKQLESIEVTIFPSKSHPLNVYPSLTGVYFVKSTVLNSVLLLVNFIMLCPFTLPAKASSV